MLKPPHMEQVLLDQDAQRKKKLATRSNMVKQNELMITLHEALGRWQWLFSCEGGPDETLPLHSYH
jgi:hypothetical protein